MNYYDSGSENSLFPPQLNSDFFAAVIQAQNNYEQKGDQQSMDKLLSFYTDCVYYFDTKQQSISLYFQAKIKQVVKEIKRFGTPQLAEKNKQKINKTVIRQMQDYNVHEKILQTQQKQKKLQQKVNKISQQQAQNLRMRMMKTKRHLNKSKSVTMSFTSIDSPDRKQMKKIEEQFGIDIKNFYFDNEDDS